jgi:protein pelota
LIVTEFNPKHGRCSLTIESSDDLWSLRRLISKGDVLVTRSSRVVKREDEYSRPDKGERVKVTIALTVEEVHLDSSIERIRVRGTIVEASDESVTKAGSHAVTLSPGHSLTLHKEKWSALDLRLVKPDGATKRFVIVSADRTEAGIGALSGSHLSILTTLESGLGGKMSEEASSRPYVSKVAGLVSQSLHEGDEVVVAGPGNFKGNIANQIRELAKGHTVTILEGLDVAGADGVRSIVKSPDFQSLAKGSVVVEMQQLVSEAVKRIGTGDPRVAYAFPRVREAASAGAVEACAVSDDVFSMGLDEQGVVDVLNEIEGRRGKVFLADSSLEFGKQISSLGGVLALLRYAIRT